MDEENQLTDVICFEKIDEINGITVFRCCVPNDPPKTSFEILPSEGDLLRVQYVSNDSVYLCIID